MFPLSCLEIRHRDDETRVRFPGIDRLDEANSEVPGQELCLLAEGLPGTRLVLDLTGIRFMTSSGLGKLVALNRKMRAAGGRLVLVNPGPAVAEVLAVTHLDKLLEVHGQANEADGQGLVTNGKGI